MYGNEDDLRTKAPEPRASAATFPAQGYRALGTGKLLHQKRADLFDESFFPEQRWSPFTARQVEYTPEELPTKASSKPRHVVRRGDGESEIVLPLNGMPSDRAPRTKAGESFDWGPLDVDDAAMGDSADRRLGQPAGCADRKRRRCSWRSASIGRTSRCSRRESTSRPYPVDSILLPKIAGQRPRRSERAGAEDRLGGGHRRAARHGRQA